MARKLGVTQATVSRWENGRLAISGPAFKLLQLLAEGAVWPEDIARPAVEGGADGGDVEQGRE